MGAQNESILLFGTVTNGGPAATNRTNEAFGKSIHGRSISPIPIAYTSDYSTVVPPVHKNTIMPKIDSLDELENIEDVLKPRHNNQLTE